MTIGSTYQSAATPHKDSPERIQDAARQFEALLISQLLRDAREAHGDDQDQTTSSIHEMAEQQLAAAMSSGGGLGLAKLITSGLSSHQSGEKTASSTSPPGSVR
jgi:Rod binding domain-containing protein